MGWASKRAAPTHPDARNIPTKTGQISRRANIKHMTFRTFRTITPVFAVAALSGALLSGCGGGDETTDTTGTPGGDQGGSAVPTFTCEFEADNNPDIIGAGRATVLGTSDEAHEQLSVELKLTGSGGTVTTSTFIPYAQPGEQFAQWVPVLDESAGDDLTCEVVSVGSNNLAGEADLDPAGATCTVTGAGLGGWEIESDLSSVEGFPSEAGKFVGTVVQLDGTRYSIDEQELAAGETTLTSTVQTEAEPTCSVRFIRDL